MSDAEKRNYVPNHDLSEVFADSVTAVAFDGANFRLELGVARGGKPGGGSDATTLHPVCRLVLPLSATNDLLAKISSAFADLERQGILKKGKPMQSKPGLTQ